MQVMIKDVADSRRLNTQIHNELRAMPSTAGAGAAAAVVTPAGPPTSAAPAAAAAGFRAAAHRQSMEGSGATGVIGVTPVIGVVGATTRPAGVTGNIQGHGNMSGQGTPATPAAAVIAAQGDGYSTPVGSGAAIRGPRGYSVGAESEQKSESMSDEVMEEGGAPSPATGEAAEPGSMSAASAAKGEAEGHITSILIYKPWPRARGQAHQFHCSCVKEAFCM
jgi:hypothetical protein